MVQIFTTITLSLIIGLLLTAILIIRKRGKKLKQKDYNDIIIHSFISSFGIVLGLGSIYYGVTGTFLLGQTLDDVRIAITIGGLALLVYSIISFKDKKL